MRFRVPIGGLDDERRGLRLVDLIVDQLIRDLSRIELQERICVLLSAVHTLVWLGVDKLDRQPAGPIACLTSNRQRGSAVNARNAVERLDG